MTPDDSVLDIVGVLHSRDQDGPLFVRLRVLRMWLQAWPLYEADCGRLG